jgi:hypothetical protein
MQTYDGEAFAVYDELFPYAFHKFLFFGYMRKEKRKQETTP